VISQFHNAISGCSDDGAFLQCLAATAAEGVEATNQKAFLNKNGDVCLAEEATGKVSHYWPI